MSLLLDRIDSVPLQSEDFSFEFRAWLGVLVDNVNYVFQQIEGLFVPTEISTTIYNAAIDNSYLIGNALQTKVNCPLTAPVGSMIELLGLGAGGWVLAPAAGQTIKIPSVNASAVTSITSAHQYDTIMIKCIVANTTWTVISSQTTGFVIV